MVNNKVSSVSFKSAYLLKGAEGPIGELNWFAHRLKSLSGDQFTHMDIKLVSATESEARKLLSKFDIGNLKKINPDTLAELQNVTYESHIEPENLDLFLTGEHKDAVDRDLKALTEHSVSYTNGNLNTLAFGVLVAKEFKRNLLNIIYGRPVSGLNADMIQEFLLKKLKPSIDVLKLPIIDAQEAYEAMLKGTFDFKDGVIKK